MFAKQMFGNDRCQSVKIEPKKYSRNTFYNTSSQGLAIHCGHALRSHLSVVGGFVLESHLMSLSLHSTKRVFTPEPHVTEHCKGIIIVILLLLAFKKKLQKMQKRCKIDFLLCPSLLSSNKDTVVCYRLLW